MTTRQEKRRRAATQRRAARALSQYGQSLNKGNQMVRGRDIAAGAGIGLVIVLLIILNIAVFVGGVVALAWGIIDTVNVGANFWSIVWIIVGGLIVLGSIGNRVRS